MAEWYFKAMGEEARPFSASDLLAKAKAGSIVADTPVRRSTDDAWFPAARIENLFTSEVSETANSSAKTPLASPKGIGIPSTWTIACLVIVSVLTIVNFILTFGGRANLSEAENAKGNISAPVDERDFRGLVSRVDADERLIGELEKKTEDLRGEMRQVEQPPIPSPALAPDLGSNQTAKTPPLLKTPRQEFISATTKRSWTTDYYTELAVGGDTVRSKYLDIHVDKIVREGNRLDIFITVKNVGTGDVFSPETHPYNEQMVFPANGKFIDSFMNWSVIRLEKGTEELKPGESATIQYSSTLKIDAAFYMWTVHLYTSNDDYKPFYIVASSEQFQDIEVK